MADVDGDWPTRVGRDRRRVATRGAEEDVKSEEALGRKHLYDALWDLPFLAAGLGAALAVQVRHNRRVRHGVYGRRKT